MKKFFTFGQFLMKVLKSLLRRRLCLLILVFLIGCFLVTISTLLSIRQSFEVINLNREFERKMFHQLHISYHSFVNSSSSEYNTDLEKFVMKEISSNLITELKSYTGSNAMDLLTKSLRASELKFQRRRIINRISREAALAYPLNIDKHQLILTKPVNNLSIGYMLNPTMLCDEKEIFLLILIKSNVNHHRLRYVIRNTWAKEAYSVFESVRVAFLIGNSLEEGISMWIENSNFGDIIQGDFVDAYKNNTYKTIMAYRWVVEYCSNARFVFFIDDDMFVNVKLTKTFLNSVDKKTESNLFSGAIVNAGRPAREKNNPWFVNKKDYPYKVYPEYLSGCAMFVSQSVIRRFNVLFPYVKYFPFDDVYLGIIANKLGIPLHNNKYLVNANINNVSALNTMIANHGFKNESYLLNTYGEFSVGDMLM